MTESLTAKVVHVTPQHARHLRDTCHFSRQRAIADLNKQRLGVEMDNGRFIPGTTVYLAVLPDKNMLILNGNHCLEAICLTGKPQWMVFIFCQVADEAEAARLYGCFDIQKTRTWADAARAIGVEKKMVMSNTAMPAVGHIMQNFTYSPRNVEANMSRDARFAAMKPYEDAAALVQAALVGAPRLHKDAIRRKGVMAVALETLRHQPGHAMVFWKDLAHDDGLAKGDPRKTLLRWLLNPTAGGGLTGANAPNTLSRGAIAAWNAWYRGDALQHLRPQAGEIFILGTPRSEPRRGGAAVPEPAPDAPTPGASDQASLGRMVADAAPEGQGSDLTDPSLSQLSDLFETGVRVTGDGTAPVVLYRQKKVGG